ncbi:MAG: fatty acid CoA ligase family protein [Myxococcota bacterium]
MINIARHLPLQAAARPDQAAVIAGRQRVTFKELDQRSDRYAHALQAAGIQRGERTLLMVKAGVDLIAVTYGMMKAGVVPVLIDPGMGVKPFLRCVADMAPTAMVGIPLAHALRVVFAGSFTSVKTHVTVGTRWFWGGPTLAGLATNERPFTIAETADGDEAAVLFTSGSTGPAKGVVYTHGMFEAQVTALLDTYGFRPGEIDCAAFPLFSLFDGALGMTSVIPDVNPSRPGTCDPAKVVAALRDNHCTTAFGSPAIWRRVAPYCIANGIKLPELQRVLIAGAPVPPLLVEQLHQVIGGDVQTPYGATESLPVANMTGKEIVGDTAAATLAGAGTCVGRPAAHMEIRLIRITDNPIATWSEQLCVPDGEVGEICVKGPVVTRTYANRAEATASAKIADGAAVWHRMGDVGYRDEKGRIWFCGRKGERVRTAAGELYTDKIEGMCNGDRRTALVGVGEPGKQRPVLIVEGAPDDALAKRLREKVPVLEAVLFYAAFPVDVRHNAKIHRHTLALWAEPRVSTALAAR